MKDIEGYEGIYAVTSCGRVWSYRKNRFLKPSYDKDGYLKVNLYKDGKIKTFQLHRLVASVYIPNPEGLPEINHKDEIKHHDWYMNLEWCTHEYNMNYGTRNERARASFMNSDTEGAKKGVYCVELNEWFDSMTAASIRTGVAQSDISKCCHGKRESAGRDSITGERLTWRFVA